MPRARVLRHMPLTALVGILLLAAPVVLPVPAAGQARMDDYAVIVHPSTPATDLSLAQLRRVFLGEQQFWPGGTRVVLFIHAPKTAARAVELRQLYRMSESEFKRYWIAKTFRDDVTTGPKIVSTDALAKKLTATVPGAIAVILASEVDDSVKVISVDNRFPGDQDYLLAAGAR